MSGVRTGLGKTILTLAPEAQAPGLARAFIRKVLAGTAAEGATDVAALLVSELVTNAVVHAASEVDLEVTIGETDVVVGVRDADTGPLTARAGGGTELDEGGRGFLLVDRLAHSWGTEHSHGRKTVWFRLAAEGVEAPDEEQENLAAADSAPSISQAQRRLRTLVLPPSIASTLTLREQVGELLARVVDVLVAQGAALELVGESEPVTVGAIDPGQPASTYDVVIDDRRVGELIVFPAVYGADDDAFLRLACDRLALLAAESGMLKEEHSRTAEHDFLSETTELLAGSTSVALCLTLLTQIVVPRLADWCAALSVDDRGRPRRLASNHRREDRTDDVHLTLDTDRELREAIFAVAGGRGPQRLPVTVPVGKQRSHVVVLPLVSRSRTLGVLVLGGPEQLDPINYMAAAELARRAGLAVENARLHEEQAATVAALQSSLLPAALPDVPGVDLAAKYHSASPGMSVGGDFYDAAVLSDGAVMLAIGDVCGKGAEAAAVTGMSRDVLRLLVQDGAAPVAALRRLNRALLDHPAASRFCTIALARVERRADRLVARLCLGGHPEPVLLRADGTTELVGTPGDVLGVLEDDELELHEAEVSLDIGDALVLYTDGITERRDKRRMFGQYGLRRTLTEAAGGDADALASAVEHAAESFVDSELRDDLAILVVRRVQ